MTVAVYPQALIGVYLRTVGINYAIIYRQAIFLALTCKRLRPFGINVPRMEKFKILQRFGIELRVCETIARVFFSESGDIPGCCDSIGNCAGAAVCSASGALALTQVKGDSEPTIGVELKVFQFTFTTLTDRPESALTDTSA